MSETDTFKEYAFLTKEDIAQDFMQLVDVKSFAVIGGCQDTSKAPYRIKSDKGKEEQIVLEFAEGAQLADLVEEPSLSIGHCYDVAACLTYQLSNTNI